MCPCYSPWSKHPSRFMSLLGFHVNTIQPYSQKQFVYCSRQAWARCQSANWEGGKEEGGKEVGWGGGRREGGKEEGGRRECGCAWLEEIHLSLCSGRAVGVGTQGPAWRTMFLLYLPSDCRRSLGEETLSYVCEVWSCALHTLTDTHTHTHTLFIVHILWWPQATCRLNPISHAICQSRP